MKYSLFRLLLFYMDYNFTLADLFKAYFDCRKNKRCKKSALKFELNLEENLLKLYKEIKSGKYKIGRSVCFVITRPKPREVWAANFRDRIVHHLIYNFISDRFHRRFIHDTYSCIPKRGTLAAAKRLLHFTRSATKNYTQKKYYLKADLSNFFVSIDKNILYSLIQKQVDEEWLLYLIRLVIFNDPVKKVILKSTRKKYNLIPHHKSLFNADSNHGLPIGNLTSQFFSNIYLNEMDQYIKQTLKCKYYVRYVDDFVIITDNPQQLNFYYNQIKKYILQALTIAIHPKKKLINNVHKGIDFVGFLVKPARIFLRANTIRRMFKIITEWKLKYNPFDFFTLDKFFKTINSYLGMLVNIDSFNIRFKVCNNANFLFLFNDIACSKMLKAIT